MALNRLPKAKWEAELKFYGCAPLEGKTQLNTADWWRWPWGGSPFTVPVEPDGFCELWAFQRILANMATLAPDDWEFPKK